MNSSLRPFRESQRTGRGNLDSLQVLEGILGTDLAAAYDTLTGATTAELHVIEWDTDTTFYQTGQTITVTNRDTSFSKNAYDYLAAAFINGEWRPNNGSGGGGIGVDVVDFVITEWLPDISLTVGCEGVFANVTRASCGSTVQVGDEILVWDPDFCWLNLPTALLIGLGGRATWMARPSTMGDVPCEAAPPIGECMWVIDKLCCREEVYG